MATRRNSEDLRASVIAAYRATGSIEKAARANGVARQSLYRWRRADAAFDAALKTAIDVHVAGPRVTVRLDARRRRAFLERLAEHGNVSRAATETGIPAATLGALRNRDARFAGDWAAAKNQALDRVEDKLFDGVLQGFTRTETVNGVTRTIVAQNAQAMFRLLGKRGAGNGRYRVIELTPGLVEEARRKVEGRIAREAAAQAEAQFAALRALPAPTTGAA